MRTSRCTPESSYSCITTFLLALCLLQLSSCSIDDEDDALPNIYFNETNSHPWSGFFAATWILEGNPVGETQLTVLDDGNANSLPVKVIHDAMFPDAASVAIRHESFTNDWRMAIQGDWMMNYASSGRSQSSYYFAIDNTMCEQPIAINGTPMQSHWFFTPKLPVAIYNIAWDQWTINAPLDSIMVTDAYTGDTVKMKHFTPAASLSLITTKRMSRNLGN